MEEKILYRVGSDVNEPKSGGSSGGSIIVHYDVSPYDLKEDETSTLDHTFAEINDALSHGDRVIVIGVNGVTIQGESVYAQTEINNIVCVSYDTYDVLRVDIDSVPYTNANMSDYPMYTKPGK